MLELKHITKIYNSGEEENRVLNDVSIRFGEHEFVSILGASGSGKTTLLNIIGGLDSYDEGDMIVDGTSTKSFKDKDWDSYRNGTIGFIFQNYQLISHLSVLENVKIALSISGLSNKESQERAVVALKDVGLEQHIYKKPNQLSGGQMQRVAIARALVTNPKIILADEPTGALDSSTSIQIMKLIKKISQGKLVIMVTHNPELAENCSSRIVRLSDGKIIEDTAPNLQIDSNKGYKLGKTSMSFARAISSSFKNLLTKKVRSILTIFAASIGIIGIASVLAISSGMNGYIKSMQEDTLSTMPITISAADSGGIRTLSDRLAEKTEKPIKEIKVAEQGKTHQNHYTEDALGGKDGDFISYMKKHAKSYYKSLNFNTGYILKAFVKDTDGQIHQIQDNVVRTLMATTTNFAVLPTDETTITDKYRLVASEDKIFKYPTGNQAILFLDSDGSLSEQQLAMLGYKGKNKVKIEELLGKEIHVLTNDQYFRQIGERFIPNEVTDSLYQEGQTLRITEIMQLKDATTTPFNGTIGYSQTFLNQLLKVEKSQTRSALEISGEVLSEESYQTMMQQLGGDNTPTSLSFYAKSFEDRKKILQTIHTFNEDVAKKYGKNSNDYERYSVSYTDMAKTVSEAFTDIIGSVTFILTAFSGISLLVSSIMIGILIYVSVVERTKEIGILRALGSRKKDISRIFNAEAGLLGLSSGVLGIGIAALLTIPINQLVADSLNIKDFTANLSPENAAALVALSIILTFFAGYIPSKIAARKNPVEALRTE
ncbi:ATP-binding cassette domain-containing protein [Streptococcus anginosus]|uniref:ABC transporter ATP-binding protein/permease n=1 Tax=Streptococcus anginosus TaxID=1328 RepID=UPI0022E2E6C3|nr:ABC transporter ATP-binding protein/permease [Streptococcus anginosus]